MSHWETWKLVYQLLAAAAVCGIAGYIIAQLDRWVDLPMAEYERDLTSEEIRSLGGVPANENAETLAEKRTA